MKKLIAVLCGVLTLGVLAAAQDQKPPAEKSETSRAESAGALYRVAVSIGEVEGKSRINERAYTLLVRPRGPGQPHEGRMRVGSRVPVQTSKDQVQYMDVGMKIDVENVREAEGQFTGTLSLEMNTVVPGEVAQAGAPVLRNMSLSAPFVLAPGKPTIVGTVDDVNSKRTFQVEVTATKLR